jgi:hypothetical protein
MEITTVGLDIAKRVFSCTASMPLARQYCGGSCNDRKCWHSSRPYRLVWSALRLAARRIIGA